MTTSARRSARCSSGMRRRSLLRSRWRVLGWSVVGVMLRLLARRGFTVDTSTQARVLQSSAAELDTWFDRAIDAGQLADVFER